MPRYRQIAVVFPLQLDPTREDVGTMEGQSLAQHQFKTMFSSHGILRGVCQFARTHNQWNLCFSENDPRGLSRFIKQWKPEGVVAHVSSDEIKTILDRSGAKVVNVSSYLSDAGVPSVVVDNLAIGRVAAQHLLESGFRRAAFVGYPGVRFSDLRLEGFVQKFQTLGQIPVAYPLHGLAEKNLKYTAENKELCRWLRALIKPVGIFCCNDGLASCIADTCRALNIRLPDDIALLGADNSEIVCELSHPPLSSVRISRERIGCLAAEMLYDLMRGKPAPKAPLLLPPDGIAKRLSTDILAIEDEDLVLAVKFIREHAHASIGVGDILRRVPVSRRLLEKKFRAILNKSPLDEIQRVHLERAKQLLTETNQNLAQVARSAGFNSSERLSVVFKQKEAMTPGEFRRRSRLNA
ncbi:MAG TPA: DNA-binding transcriptional regulator [Planctomycetota bacterium]|nr:DNA-binding transcriptional regulator [Planctomycetota bacterium]